MTEAKQKEDGNKASQGVEESLASGENVLESGLKQEEVLEKYKSLIERNDLNDWISIKSIKKDEEDYLNINFRIKDDFNEFEGSSCESKDFEKLLETLMNVSRAVRGYGGRDRPEIIGFNFNDISKKITLINYNLGGQFMKFADPERFISELNTAEKFWNEFGGYDGQEDLEIIELKIDFDKIERVMIRKKGESSKELNLNEFEALIGEFEKLTEIEKEILGIYMDELREVEKEARESFNKSWMKRETLKTLVGDYIDNYYIKEILFKSIENGTKEFRNDLLEDSVEKIFNKIKRQRVLRNLK